MTTLWENLTRNKSLKMTEKAGIFLKTLFQNPGDTPNTSATKFFPRSQSYGFLAKLLSREIWRDSQEDIQWTTRTSSTCQSTLQKPLFW
jgi:hypothetical protein